MAAADDCVDVFRVDLLMCWLILRDKRFAKRFWAVLRRWIPQRSRSMSTKNFENCWSYRNFKKYLSCLGEQFSDSERSSVERRWKMGGRAEKSKPKKKKFLLNIFQFLEILQASFERFQQNMLWSALRAKIEAAKKARTASVKWMFDALNSRKLKFIRLAQRSAASMSWVFLWEFVCGRWAWVCVWEGVCVVFQK